MSGRKRKNGKRTPAVALVERPTPERAAKGEFVSAGMAHRITPVIDTLLVLKMLTASEHAALAHYREQAHKAQDDEAESSTLSPERIMGGGGRTIISGPLPAKYRYTPAIAETARIERELGELQPIARAIAVEDMTLTAWCVQQHGGREKFRSGKVVAIVPRGTDDGVKHLAVARMELRTAAWRIVGADGPSQSVCRLHATPLDKTGRL